MTSVSTSTQRSASTSSSQLRKGAHGAGVRELQTMLKSLGLYGAAIDGDFGNMTDAAVRAFQRKYGLKVDGYAGPVTLAKLRAVLAPKPPANTPAANSGGKLMRGATGPQVVELQTLLQKLGYYRGNIGGNFGAQTEAAVKQFQMRNGLTVDGWAGPQTMAKLRAARPGQQPTPPVTTPTGPVPPTTGSPNARVQAALDYGRSVIGSPYAAVNPFRFGEVLWDGQPHRSVNGSGTVWNYPRGTRVFDCSGFVCACFKRAGVDLAARGLSSSGAIRNNSNGFLQNINKSDLKPGDLITYAPKNGVGHVVIYLGNGQCIEAAGGAGVRVSNVNWERADAFRRVPV